MGLGCQDRAPAASPLLKRDPLRVVQEAWWVQGPIWTGSENLAPTRIRAPDRPARSQSPY
jgi:hypothetical protein